MDRFSGAVRGAIENRNWYAALSLSLLIPDICGRLEDPAAKSQARYVKWYERFMLGKYTHNLPDGPHVFLSGNDCYALRCALSHEGRGDISDQRAQEVLSGFAFIEPDPNIDVHCNQINNVLQLRVDRFALDMCDATDAWSQSVAGNAAVLERIDQLIRINSVRDGIPGFITFK